MITALAKLPKSLDSLFRKLAQRINRSASDIEEHDSSASSLAQLFFDSLLEAYSRGYKDGFQTAKPARGR